MERNQSPSDNDLSSAISSGGGGGSLADPFSLPIPLSPHLFSFAFQAVGLIIGCVKRGRDPQHRPFTLEITWRGLAAGEEGTGVGIIWGICRDKQLHPRSSGREYDSVLLCQCNAGFIGG